MADKPQKPAAEFDIKTFEATRNLVSQQVQRLEELKKDIKLQAEKLNNIFENDEALVKAQEAVKEISQKAKTRKTELLETTQAKNIKLKIADLKEERSDIEDSLTLHLLDLYQTTGVMEFEDTQGSVWEYNLKAKLKPAKG